MRHYETTKDEAEQIGAIAFFGDKYGDIVRVLEAGPHASSCAAAPTSGHRRHRPGQDRVSEGSIGSNLRRIEAVTGFGPIELLRRDEDARSREVGRPARHVADDAWSTASRSALAEIKELRDELKALRRQAARGRAAELAAGAVDGVVVARVDGLAPDDLRELGPRRARPARRAGRGARGARDTGGASLVAAVTPDSGLARRRADRRRGQGRQGRRRRQGRPGRGRRQGPDAASTRRSPSPARGAASAGAGVDQAAAACGCSASTSARKRIGVAVSDRGGTLASAARGRCARRQAPADDHAAIAALVAEEEAERIVVGLPLSLDGRVGPAAAGCHRRGRASWPALGVPGRDLR